MFLHVLRFHMSVCFSMYSGFTCWYVSPCTLVSTCRYVSPCTPDSHVGMFLHVLWFPHVGMFLHVLRFHMSVCFSMYSGFTCRYVSPCTPVSTTNKSDHHDITQNIVEKNIV
jgi:hypothetical protein